MGLELASICPCVCVSTLSNINISKTSRPIVIKFHLEHNKGVGFTALSFGLDRIRTLVSMATDSSHRVIMGGGDLVTNLVPSFLIGSSLFLQVTRRNITSWMGLKLGSIQRRTYELAALERLEKSP